VGPAASLSAFTGALRSLSRLGRDIVGNTPQAFAELTVAERRKWGDIIKSANIAAQ
jgi:hypothetical protein